GGNLERDVDRFGHEVGFETVEMGLHLVLDREVAAATDPGLDSIRRCLAVAPEATDLVARLHPDDAASMELVMEVAGRRVAIVADPNLSIGEAVVEADDSVIDGRISEALERVAQVLR
ncbi:MAG: FliH/SctL family protein, partial [Actinomycetota bacterium]